MMCEYDTPNCLSFALYMYSLFVVDCCYCREDNRSSFL